MPCLPTDRVLNLLHCVKWDQDGTLTFRRSCAHGVCGSDAMRINGVQPAGLQDPGARTCYRARRQAAITIEPIKGLPVEKDLVVDMEPFFEAYRAVKPFLITNGNAPTRERMQSPDASATASTTRPSASSVRVHDACPVFWNDGQYFGPAGDRQRAPVHLRQPRRGRRGAARHPERREGVWRCRTTFNCTEACPRGIQITKAIPEVKRALMFAR